MEKKIQVYFQTVTPESAADGDFAETGDHDVLDVTPDRHDIADGITAVDLAVKALKDAGASEASSSHYHNGIWYSTVDADEDLRTGEQTFYSFHLEGFSETEQKQIFEKIKGA